MMNITKFETLEHKLIEIQDRLVLLDRDVAELFGIETKDVNKAVKNNPDKFPDGYIIELTNNEKKQLVENFHRFNKLKHSTVSPKAFTEKGLYMLATILKSAVATSATLQIIETFAKIKALSRNINALENAKTQEEQKEIAQNVGEIFEEIIDLEPVVEKDGDEIIEVENRIELNIGFVKVSRTTKSKKSKNGT